MLTSSVFKIVRKLNYVLLEIVSSVFKLWYNFQIKSSQSGQLA